MSNFQKQHGVSAHSAAPKSSRGHVNLLALALQAAHDMKAPISALRILQIGLEKNQRLEGDHRLTMNSALERLMHIANSLTESSRPTLASSRRPKLLPGSNDVAHVFPTAVVSYPPARPYVRKPLRNIIEGVLAEKRTQYATSKPQVSFNADIESMDEFLEVPCSPGELARVLSNLLDNAVEAIRMDGKIWIRIRRRMGFAYVHISDSGMGIPREVLPILMKRPFTYNKTGGSGRGLLHAREIVSSVGGKIRLHSQLGQGTVV